MNFSLEIILTAALTLFIVQSIKLATDGIKGNFDLKNIFTVYGGMPSSHTAVVASLSTIVAYKAGVNSLLFGICVIFSLIIIGDAMVFRGYIDKNGKALQKLISKLSKEEQSQFPPIYTKLRHSLPQVLIGAIIGFSIASLIQILY